MTSTTRSARSAGAGVARWAGALAPPVVLAVLLGAPVGAAGGPAFEQLWEVPLGLPSRGTSDVRLVDFDGDGRTEILIARWRRGEPGDLLVLDGATGSESWRVGLEERPYVETCDVGGDGRIEVLAAVGNGLLVIDGASGETITTVGLAGEAGALAVGHLDGDETVDVVYAAGDERCDVLVALAGAGEKELWRREAEPAEGRFDEGFGFLVATDVDGDGLDEVLVTENMNVLLCLASGGDLSWSAVLGEKGTLVPEGAASSVPVVADLLGDGVNEIAVGCYAGALVVLDGATGEALSRSAPFGIESHARYTKRGRFTRPLRELLARTGEPILGLLAVDLVGGPARELAFGCADGIFYAVDPRTGTELWRYEEGGKVTEPAVAVDATGDGVADLLVRDQGGAFVLDGTGEGEVDVGPLPDVRAASSVVAGDVNADGVLDLVVVSVRENRVAAWTTGLPCPSSNEESR